MALQGLEELPGIPFREGGEAEAEDLVPQGGGEEEGEDGAEQGMGGGVEPERKALPLAQGQAEGLEEVPGLLGERVFLLSRSLLASASLRSGKSGKTRGSSRKRR